ncbi:hypothetical protein PV797_15410 [Clostridiaceae bacterium M8S5]|nr:hypothetical protein PV797_15410 [Clostridiaceae bacterium M8S5]
MKKRNIILLIALVFLAFSSYSLIHTFEYMNTSHSHSTYEIAEGVQKYRLEVLKDTKIYLKFDASLKDGYIEIMLKNKDSIIDKHRITDELYINKSYALQPGVYEILLIKKAVKGKEYFYMLHDGTEVKKRSGSNKTTHYREKDIFGKVYYN